VELLLAGGIDKALAATCAAQLNVRVTDRRHSVIVNDPGCTAGVGQVSELLSGVGGRVRSVRAAHPWLPSAAILGLAVLVTACGGGAGGQSTPPAIATNPPPIVSPVLSPVPESSSNAEKQAAVDAAMQDAAGRLSLASGAGDIHVQQVEARQWPDSSLGCPRPEVMYSQIVTPGYLVVISAAGKQLEYHADARGRIVFCQEL
jgi:hypothetical protein